MMRNSIGYTCTMYLVQCHTTKDGCEPVFKTLSIFSTKSAAEAFLEAYYESTAGYQEMDAKDRSSITKQRSAIGQLTIEEVYKNEKTRLWIQSIDSPFML